MNPMPSIEELIALVKQNQKLNQLIQTTIPSMDGWCDLNKATVLAGLVLHLKPVRSVEIGVWGGRSLLPMAWAAKQVGNSQVIGIDPYDPKVSAENEMPPHDEWWGKQDHELVMRRFHAYIKRFQLDNVLHIRKKSDEVDPPDCQLLHIDGSHTEQAVKDAERFGPKVTMGGVVVCDDVLWTGGGVLRAIDALEEMGFKEFYRNTTDNWNAMRRENVKTSAN